MTVILRIAPVALPAARPLPWWEALRPHRPSVELFTWAATQPSYEEAWEACTRADYLLEIAARSAERGTAEHRQAVLGACAVARVVLPLAPRGESRPRLVLETAERWCAGIVHPNAVAGAVSIAEDAIRDAERIDPRNPRWRALESAAEAAYSIVETGPVSEGPPLAAMLARMALTAEPSLASELELADLVRRTLRRPVLPPL